MKSIGGVLGWALVALTLALPALMFWNWWQKMQHRNEPAESKGAARGTSKVFAGEESPLAAARRAAPAGLPASSTSTAAGTAAASTTSLRIPPTMPAAAASEAGVANAAVGGPMPMEAGNPVPPLSEAATGQASAGPKAAAGGRTAPAALGAPAIKGSSGPISGVAVSTVAVYAPKTDRDPFVSLIEVQMARDAERRAEMARLEEERRRREAEEAAKRAAAREKTVKPKAPSEPPIESRLTIQGIISTPDHKSAIVNNDVVNVGEVVLGAEVVEITDSAVIFNYKGRRVRMVVPR